MAGKLYDENRHLYTEESIESLSPLAFTRLRPQVYCGDTANSTQLLVEIIANAVDEYNLGHGNKIDVNITNDTISVRDYGQGFIPNSFRDDGKTILEAAFSVLNTSGKYRDDGVYSGTSLGSFGIGSKITCFLSHWLNVTTARDGKTETILFREGVFDTRDEGTCSAEVHGTTVRWKPSEEFFTDTHVDIPTIRKLFKVITCLCPGLTITLTLDGKEEIFFSEHGLNDLIDEAVGDKELIKNRLSIKYTQGKYKLDLGLTYTSNYSSTIVPYVNTGLTERGPHITQIKTVITREFNKFFKEKKWLKDKEETLSGDDIQEGMYVVFNLTAPNVAYDAQVKSTVTKLDMTPFTSALASEIQVWLAANEKEIKIIADKAINARKAREAAKKARDAIRTVDKKDKKKKLSDLPTKLVDANNKKRSECELFITEGDSAASGLIKGRDSDTQAIFPIRGKIINVYKASNDKIFANQEVVNLIKALGLDLDKNGKLIYDERKLRYGKIIPAADADPDGQAIRNLLITLFWWLCPELILNGHIYIAIPPLFRITTKKNEYIFLKDAKALEDYKTQHQGEKFLINRNKGLGEQDPSELSECLLEKETRNLVQLTVEDAEEASKLLEIFMGTSVPPRREWLLEHSEEAKGEFDI